MNSVYTPSTYQGPLPTSPYTLEEFLHIWPRFLMADFLCYAIPASILFLLLVLAGKRLAGRRIQAGAVQAPWREVGVAVGSSIVFSLVGVGVYFGDLLGWLQVGHASPSLASRVLSLLAMVVAHDAYFYWTHRLLHHRRLFRRFHRVHHMSRSPTAFAAYAFAPQEGVIQAVFVPLYLLLVETNDLVVAIFLGHMILRNIIGHCGVELYPKNWLQLPLLRASTTPTHHDMHHQWVGYNYGLYFRWWDRWCKTENPDYQARFEAKASTTHGE